MSIFAGAPDYSHIIWTPQRFPEGDGISGLMNGIAGGLISGQGMADQKGEFKKAKAQAESEGRDMTPEEKRLKPNGFKWFFGADPNQLDAMNQGQTASYLDGVNTSISALIDAQQEKLSMLERMNMG